MRWLPVLFLLGLCTACLSQAAAQTLSVDEILAKVAAADGMQTEGMRFQQHIRVRMLFFSWDFTSRVTRRGDELEIEVGPGAPGWMPADMSATLVNLHGELDPFELTLVGEERGSNGRRYYVIAGERKERTSHGVQSGKLWVDSQEWYIAKAELAYTWGRLQVEQEYRTEQGRRVLHAQRAVGPFGARINVEYREYWFENGKSDIL